MYQFNRTGVQQQFFPDQALWNPVPTAYDTNNSAVYPKVNSTSPLSTRYERVYSNFALPAGEQYAVGVGIVPDRPLALQHFECVANGLVTADRIVTVQVFLARCDNSTLSGGLGAGQNVCSNPVWLPMVQDRAQGSVVAFSSESTLYYGDLDDAAPSDNPLVCGVRIMNIEGAVANGVLDCSWFARRAFTTVDTFEEQR